MYGLVSVPTLTRLERYIILIVNRNPPLTHSVSKAQSFDRDDFWLEFHWTWEKNNNVNAKLRDDGVNVLDLPSQSTDETEEFDAVAEALATAIEQAGVDFSDIDATLREVRKQEFAKHYPELALEDEEA